LEKFKLKVKEEYRALLPPLPPGEYEALERSILENGQLEPIIANPDGVVLDGHSRYEICTKHGIEPKYIVREFDDPLDEKKYVIESNLMRRQLTTFQRIETALPLIEIERELAEKRKLSRLKKGEKLPNVQNFGQRGRTMEIVAKRIGVSDELLRQALYVMEHAPKEELDKLRSGEMAISNLYKKVKNSVEKKAENRAKCVTARLHALLRLLKPPKEKFLEVSKYANTNHTIYTVKSPLHEKIERCAEKLNTTPDTLAQNIMEEKLREIEALKPEDIEMLQQALKQKAK